MSGADQRGAPSRPARAAEAEESGLEEMRQTLAERRCCRLVASTLVTLALFAGTADVVVQAGVPDTLNVPSSQ